MSDFQATTSPADGGARTVVVHQPELHRFVAGAEPGAAILDYQLFADNHINFHHTYVPSAQRGRGIAETLVRTGLAWAREQGLRIEASCWYVQRFLPA